MSVGGPQTWVIEGQAFRVLATYYSVNDGRLQFVVEWACGRRCEAIAQFSDEQALLVALPVMRYAVASGQFTRTSMRKDGARVEPELVGVVLIPDMGASKNGYRVARAVEEIRSVLSSRGSRTERDASAGFARSAPSPHDGRSADQSRQTEH
jgi:hypothetical protein